LPRVSRLDDYRWLVSDQGAWWLRRAAEDRRPLMAQAGRLRKELSAERVHLVLQQVELRQRGRAKFADAERMFFTPIGLEQATGQTVARYKASRFPQQEPLADLCCGIGGDLLALLGRGPGLGVERDPITALLAEANLRAVGLIGGDRPAAEVRVEDVARFPASQVAAWHLDPDRRPEGRRTTSLGRCRPGLPVIERLLARQGEAAVKLAPATTPPQSWTYQAELEWISRQGQCRQLVAWFGRLAEQPGLRRATILGEDGAHDSGSLRTLVGSTPMRPPVAARIGRYVFDPDPAVLASGLLGTLAAEDDLAALAPNVAYLTGDRPLEDPALGCFDVTDVLPMDLKRLKRLLHGRGIGALEIKKRGVAHDLEALRRRLHLRGDAAAVLLIAPIRGQVTAILARRT
jgi:hypothetical protein